MHRQVFLVAKNIHIQYINICFHLFTYTDTALYDFFCCSESSLPFFLYLYLTLIFLSHLPVSHLFFSSSSSCSPWHVIKHEHQPNSLTLSLSPILSSLFSPFPSVAFLSICTPSLPLFWFFPPSSALWTWPLLRKLSSGCVCVIMKKIENKIQDIKTKALYQSW